MSLNEGGLDLKLNFNSQNLGSSGKESLGRILSTLTWLSSPGCRTGITGAGPRGALGPFRGVAGHDTGGAGGGIGLEMLQTSLA